MSDRMEWFAPKRYGYGTGLPISWQGWAITLGFMVIVLAAAVFFATQPLVLFAIVIPLTVALLVITARTTRGGWRWRWPFPTASRSRWRWPWHSRWPFRPAFPC